MRAAGKVSALVLAAGSSSRMGASKALLQVGRFSAIEEAVVRFREAGIDDMRVIVGCDAGKIVPVVERLKAKWIFNESYRDGMLSSVLTGIRSFEPDIEAFFVLPVDTPLIQPRTIRKCLDAYRQSYAPVIHPCFRGRRGHPPLIAARCASKLTADQEGGLRAFLRRYDAQALDVSVADEGIVMGFNTPEEHQRLLAYGLRESAPAGPA